MLAKILAGGRRGPLLLWEASKKPSLLVQNRHFRTTQPRQALPPILLTLVKPLSRFLAAFVGRRARIWWKRLPEHEKLKIKDASSRGGRIWGGLAVFLAAFAFYGYESHLEVCPITGRKRFMALRKDQVQKIATIEFDKLIMAHGNDLLPDNHHYYDRIANVCMRILKANMDMEEVKAKKWTISVIGQTEQNAFVLPSGNIFVYTGMLDVCTNDDQLGIVLSHEIAHTLLNHAAENLSYVNMFSAMFLIPLAVMWAFLPNDGISLVADWFFHRVSAVMLELPFSRHMETEADEVGLRLASKACFDVRAAPALWGKMQIVAEMNDEFQPPEFLSTHPSHETRQQNLSSLLSDAIKLRSECGCPALGRTDPNLELKLFTAAMKAAAKENAGKSHKPRMVVV